MSRIDELTRQTGEWLRGEGPMSEVVISSRIRLARNLKGYPFLSRADQSQQRKLYRELSECITASPIGKDIFIADFEELSELDRQVLVERHLISRQHAHGEGARGVAVSGSERQALMVNEEDHLRIQVLRSGLRLEALWEEIRDIDLSLEKQIEYAYDQRYGYLTACPTNVGTGLRVSVMLHLPALKLVKEIDRVFRAAHDMKLAVRGIYGEGTDAVGDFYQVSNQVTLGRTEEEIIDEFGKTIIPKMVEYELKVREAMARERPYQLDDKIWRAYGILKNARAMSSEEALFLLSHIRMGVAMGRFKHVDVQTINELLLQTQPAHLQKIHQEKLSGEQRSIKRAKLLRARLEKHQPRDN
ncbi:MAG: protein arginine kinase [Phycisphaerae bacterium]|nr:protein arginine kinase [Phycisphaerae bacterium]